jgi:hypothetical protein
MNELRFEDTSIRAAALRVLNSLPTNTKGVFLDADVVQKDGQKPALNIGFAFRPTASTDWNLVIAYQKDWEVKQQSGTIQVRHTW